MIEQTLKQERQNINTTIALFLGMLLFKFSMELSHWLVLMDYYPDIYVADFSPLKYAVGLLWCIVLFFGIRHTEHKASAFLLYLMYLLQIIPITVVYALSNGNSAYYNVLCLGFLLCELLAGRTSNQTFLQRNTFLSKTMCLCFAAATVLVVSVVILQNGVPSSIALNVFKVYEIRRSGEFQLNKYLHYILTWITAVLLPAATAKCLVDKRYFFALASCGVTFLLYLYTGHKTYLFSIPLVVVCSLWAKRKNFYRELFLTSSIGCAALCLLTCAFPYQGGIFYRIYSLLIRRSILDTANTKFFYYDYFTANPKLGLGGMFPRWLLQVNNPYANLDFQHEIGRIYFNEPEMNAGTGFLAEGYMRFGHLGTILVLLLFAFLLKQVDRLQDRTGYALAVGIFVYPVFALSDAHLLDSFVIGPWMILLFILIFYGTSQKPRGRLNPYTMRLSHE